MFENSLSQPLSLAHERNRTSRSRSSNLYIKRILYGNRTPDRDRTTWQATDPADLSNDTWMFEVVFDYGEGHYIEDRPDNQQRVFASARINAASGSAWPARLDRFSSYRAGFEVRTYRLCHRVLMFHHFPHELGMRDYLVRSTEFDYTNGPVATFIRGVLQSGYVDQSQRTSSAPYLKKSLPPLEFEYSRVPTSQELAGLPVRSVDEESLENLPVGLDGKQYLWMDLDRGGNFRYSN